KDGARHFANAQKKGLDKIDVAVAIGPDPAVSFAGAVPLPPDVDEMILAGYLRGAAVEMVKCQTIDLEVPANAEIILEGYVKTNEKQMEGPFGDHTGFYSLPEEYPVFHLTCITHRKDPIYQTMVVGRPPMEDCFIGLAIERMFLPLIKMYLPEVVDIHMPFEGVFHNLLLVSIKKSYPGHARKVMHALWGMGQAMFSKVIVVVDNNVNIHDTGEVVWKVLNNIDPQRDLEFALGPVDVLDHASREIGYGSKVGIDATRKMKEEGFTRPWPDEMTIPPEIKMLVDKKWGEIWKF
ncbi:MAG: UbiD family decarboxylase, partial [Planctomycetota bacterium]